MYTTLVKSFSEPHPFDGCASAPVDVHRYVDGRAHALPVGVGVVGVDVPDRPVHCWLVPDQQEYSWILVRLVVAAPTASRHSPDWTPAIVPLVLTFHCWAALPSQSSMTTAVPLPVPLARALRHLLP